jgi:hypothetical protein
MSRNTYTAWGSAQLHEGSPPDPIMGQIIPIQYFIRNYTEIKRPKRGADRPLHLAPRLKKEYSYTSTSLLGLHDLF